MNFPTFLNTMCDKMCDENGNPISADVATTQIKMITTDGQALDIGDCIFIKSVNTLYISPSILKGE